MPRVMSRAGPYEVQMLSPNKYGKATKTPYIVEVAKNNDTQRLRRFTTKASAVKFYNAQKRRIKNLNKRRR